MRTGVRVQAGACFFLECMHLNFFPIKIELWDFRLFAQVDGSGASSRILPVLQATLIVVLSVVRLVSRGT